MVIDKLEQSRLLVQKQLDDGRSQSERNRLGQFSTPTGLARDIILYGLSLIDDSKNIRFLDPAFGTGSFYSALVNVIGADRIEAAYGYEIDTYYGNPAQEIWRKSDLNLRIEDFTKVALPTDVESQFNFIICNPPYVRHHHISNKDKLRLKGLCKDICGIRVDGLAGLYCYFLLISHGWMQHKGIAAWLIPSEFMDVNYGKEIKYYLVNKVKLIRIHRFNPSNVQFDNALVSSTVLWFRNEIPEQDHEVEFTFGGDVNSPEIKKLIPLDVLKNENKWTRFPVFAERKKLNDYRLSDFFSINRGIATGDNKFFILTGNEVEKHQLPDEFLRPILPSPRYLIDDEIHTDMYGFPIIKKRLFLLDCRLPENKVKENYPRLWGYLQIGKDAVSKRYICRNRKVWYFQEQRAPAKLLCTYIGRSDKPNGKPFRFILNHSKAIASNVYLLMYPKPVLARELEKDSKLLRKIWMELNRLSIESLVGEGRVYGGGLHKLEPKELGNVNADPIVEILPNIRNSLLIPKQEVFDLDAF